jgi:protein-L-isoaspartate(D-aspartate) O-methyltransferase
MAMNFEAAREQMVEDQLRARGIKDARVLAAMRTIPRHLFVDESMRQRAYEDSPLPIDAAQTISQPYMVALMSEVLELDGSERVLEIGTGSGYQAAVLAELAAEVFSVERLDVLADSARARLAALGYGEHVHVQAGDGGHGWASAAPFDAILVTAAVQSVPRPLVEQLADNGALVLPLGEVELQGLARIRRDGSGLRVDYFGECRFVRLIGEYGWEE